MNILVTGGTGTLGQVLVPELLNHIDVDRIRVLSRDEHKQTVMQAKYPKLPIDYFVGDVRDRERMWYATRGVDVVFHLAAVKSVDKAEYNPNEAIATNITGTQNVVDACIRNNVKKAIITSTDKAVEPLNVYGATKLTAESVFVQSNSYSGVNGTVFGAVRYGNVLGSNGSVIQKWAHAVEVGDKPLMTDAGMTRFWISQIEAARFVIKSCLEMGRGEVRIPKMKACFMSELYDAFCSVNRYAGKYDVVGLRPGEKRDERLFGAEEVRLVTDCGDVWIKWPTKPCYPIQKMGEPVKKALSSRDALTLKKSELEEMIRGAI